MKKSPAIYYFGQFAFCPNDLELRSENEKMMLMPRESQVLEVLIKNAGHVVSKDDLMEEIWGLDPVEEVNIAKLVHLLRKNRQLKEYIETCPRRGYKFIGTVKSNQDEEKRDQRQTDTGLSAAIMAGPPSFELFAFCDQLDDEAAMFEEWAAKRRTRAALLRRDRSIREIMEFYMIDALTKEGKERATALFMVVQKASRELIGPAQDAWFSTIECTHDNLIRTLDYYHHDATSADRELELAVLLAQFWETSGHWSQGREVLQRALDRQGPSPSSLKAQALAWLGMLLCAQNHYEQAKRSLLESMTMSRVVEDKQCLAFALEWLAVIADTQGHHREAKKFLAEGLKVSEEIHSDRMIIRIANRFGRVAEAEGDCVASKEYYLQCLRKSQYIQDIRYIASASSNLSTIASEQGDYVEARRHLERGMALRQSLRHRWGVADCYYKLGGIEESAGHNRDAENSFRKSLAVNQEIGDKHGLARATEGIGRIMIATGDESGAALVLGAADTIRASIGVVLSSNERKKYGHLIATARKNNPRKWKAGGERAAEIVADLARDPS